MSASLSPVADDRFVIVDDCDDDITQILIVACERTQFRSPDWAMELDGGGQ